MDGVLSSACQIGNSCRLRFRAWPGHLQPLNWITWTHDQWAVWAVSTYVGSPPARDSLACISRAYWLSAVLIREGTGSSRIGRRNLVLDISWDQIIIAPRPPSLAASPQSEACFRLHWGPTGENVPGPMNALDQSGDIRVHQVLGWGKFRFKDSSVLLFFRGQFQWLPCKTPLLASSTHWRNQPPF